LNDYPLSQASQMLWGNWDYVTGANQFNSSEVPSAFSDSTGSPSIYANPLPSSHTLPCSFYLASCAAPSWWSTLWGTPPFPAIGPDVTGGNVPNTGGHANLIPAAVMDANAPIDPAYQVSYAISAISCTSGTVTLTVAALPAVPGGKFTATGISVAGYNGTFPVAAPSSTTSITYILPTCPSGTPSGGNVLYPDVLVFNAANYYGGSFTVATPTFSPVAGTYSSTQTVTISTSTGGATLCYTTDGSTPTESGNACYGGTTQTYTVPITVSATQTVKALGTLSGYTDSSVASAAYTITAGAAPAPATNLLIQVN
jgi:hypothetical protein